MSEITWIKVDGYEDKYEVNNIGEARSIPRKYKNSLGRNREIKEYKILSPITDKDGYKIVGLCSKAKVKLFRLHRLIAMAFLKHHKKSRRYINHKNGIKSDNRVENLEWVTALENVHHYIKTGLPLRRKPLCL